MQVFLQGSVCAFAFHWIGSNRKMLTVFVKLCNILKRAAKIKSDFSGYPGDPNSTVFELGY